MKKIPALIFCIFLIFLPLSVWSVDLGLILDQSAGIGSDGSNFGFDYSGMLIPRLSVPVGENGSLFVSAGLKLDYFNKSLNFVPELLLTELNMSFDKLHLTAGRMSYSDPLGFVVGGFLDGARVSMDTDKGTFSFGVWYTGLLYKKRANITMTIDELESFYTDVEYSDFFNTYFAPHRFLAAVDWEHPSLNDIIRIRVSLLGQFDVGNGSSSSGSFSTQYLTAKLTMPVKGIVLEAGGSLELSQDSGELGMAFAGQLGAAFTLPTPFDDMLSITGRFSNGKAESSSLFTTFTPVTSIYMGEIFRAKFSGISVISLDYIARINSTFSAGLSSNYFIRSDLEVFNGQYGIGNTGFFLGNEFFARAYWSPASDLSLNGGGGVFLPFLGNAAPNTKVHWRMELNVVMSLY